MSVYRFQISIGREKAEIVSRPRCKKCADIGRYPYILRLIPSRVAGAHIGRTEKEPPLSRKRALRIDRKFLPLAGQQVLVILNRKQRRGEEYRAP